MGGSGVQRPLKFVKYLREFGWNPIVLCPEPGRYPYFDESLAEELASLSVEVIRINPDTLFHVGTKSSSASQNRWQVPDLFAKIARRILRLFLYPDNKKGWIAPAIEKGNEILSSRNIKAIFSTAPPFSNHIVGKELSKSSGVPLVLDYRDAWLNNHFMDGMFDWQKKKMLKLEQECVAEADSIIGLDDFMLQQMKDEYELSEDTLQVIPHGYDPEDFEKPGQPTLDYKKGKLNFLYSGLFYEQNQPDVFLKALRKAIVEKGVSKEKIHLHFQGGLDHRIKELIRKLNFEDIVSDYGYQTHSQAVANLKQADVLWMISNFDSSHKQVKSGKLFEYFGAQKPVLGLVQDGKEAELLRQYTAGFIAKVDSIEDTAETLVKIFSSWNKQTLPAGNSEFTGSFNRKQLTQKLAQIFDKISSQ